MAEMSIEYQIGQMTAQITGMREEIGQVREDGRAREESIVDRLERSMVRRLEQHDKRDDERFESLGARLGAAERGQHAQSAIDQAEQQQTNNRIVLLAAAIAATAALLAAVLPLFHGGH